MHSTDGEKVRTEQPGKLYVRFNQPEALVEQISARRSELNKEIYLKVLGPSQGVLSSVPLLEVETEAHNLLAKQDDETWKEMFRQFKTYVSKNGHTYVSSNPEYDSLKDWINRQILNKPFLKESQFRKLDELGVNWNIGLSRDHAWELMFRRLEVFKNEFGNCRVPHGWEKDKQLALWVMRQRKMNLQGKIQDYRRLALDQIGFTWDIKETYNVQWESFLQQLADFKNEFGHCNVPGKYIKLVSWIERQRLSKKKNLLSNTREQRLNELGFIWGFDKIRKKDWDEKYQLLADFNKIHGHSFIPVKYKENKLLGNWVALQRKLQVQGKLSSARFKKLDKLNFVWSAQTQTRLRLEYDTLWKENFEKLKEYKHKKGTCQVSLKTDPKLQAWTIWQRKMYYEGRISTDRIAKLESISFPWNINEGYWQKMFELLSSFHNRFGHTRVPSHWAENPSLSAWVYRMRAEKHELAPAKISLLNKMGFDWTLQTKTVEGWPAMYNRLLAFKKDFGHARVPVRWPDDPKLGKWVSRMRNEKKKLNKERLTLLQAAGFHW